MSNFADNIYNKIKEKQAPVVLKLNPVFESIPGFIREKYKSSGTPIVMFNKIIIDSIYETVPAIMMNIPSYLRYGMGGVLAMKATEVYAKEKNLTVFYDSDFDVSKENCETVTDTFFDTDENKDENDLQGSTFNGDAVTLSLYGVSGTDYSSEIFEILHDYLASDRGVFIKYTKSTAGSPDAVKNVRMFYEKYEGSKGLSSLGLYIKNTEKTQILSMRKELKHMFFMVDHGESDALAFDEYGKGGLIVLPDSVVYAYKTPKFAEKYDEKAFVEAMTDAVNEIIDKINGAV